MLSILIFRKLFRKMLSSKGYFAWCRRAYFLRYLFRKDVFMFWLYESRDEVNYCDQT